MATEILHENNGYGEKLWEQVCDELQHHHKQQLERRVEQAAHQARYQWRRWHIAHALPRTRGVHALRLHASLFHSLWWHRTPHSSSSERIHTSICMVIHGAPSLIRLLPFLLPFPLVCHRLPLPPRAVRWAPLHDGHGKPAQLRCRREWGHPERLHLSHRLWAQPPDLRRAQRLISSLLLHDPFTDQDVDDVTLGEMLTAAHRGQVDYCVPGGMSVSQSVVVCNVRSGQPDGVRMVDRSGQPDERNSSNAQIRSLLEEQRQTIIAEYREKVGHHELHAAYAKEERRLLQGQLWWQKIGISWSSSTKSHRNGRITEIPEFYLRYYRETKTHRGSEHYFGIIRQSTGISKWSKLYKRFWGFSRCWISSQWKFPRYQSTSVIPTSSDTWRDVEAFFRIAEPQRRAAKHLGHTWFSGNVFADPHA